MACGSCADTTTQKVAALALAIALTCFVFASVAHAGEGRFVGELVLKDIDPNGRNFELEEPFEYIDPSGVEWRADKGLVTDGASIPQVFWSIVGGPYEGPYRRAAIIHDYYCDHKYRSWERTHRVFYDAMITGGVSPTKAKLMYYAVWRFGPRWSVEAILPCSGSELCAARPSEFQIVSAPFQSNTDNISDAKAELESVAARLDTENLSVDQLEEFARSKPEVPRGTIIIRPLSTSKFEDYTKGPSSDRHVPDEIR
jgi:hypothetical protein